MRVTTSIIDLKKACNSVEIEKVMEAIVLQGVYPVQVEVLQYIYTHSSSFIRLHKNLEPSQFQKGVRLGDTSSAKLFAACFQMIFRRLDWENK